MYVSTQPCRRISAEGREVSARFPVISGLAASPCQDACACLTKEPEGGNALCPEAARSGTGACHPDNNSKTPALVRRQTDPYYPFEQAVDVWARTFAALGINYKVRP